MTQLRSVSHDDVDDDVGERTTDETAGEVVDEAESAGEGTPTAPIALTVAELYRTERRRLLRLAALFVSDRAAAEDLVQDAFAALQRHWPTMDDQAGAAGYLSVSVANGARSLIRRRKVAFRRLRASEPDEVAGADAPLLLAEEHREVAAAVRALPRRQQQVVALRYWSGLSEAEIAAALGVSTGTVKSSAARGLANIQRTLEANGAAE